MLPPGLQTAQEVKAYYNDVYNSLIDSGQYTPFLYPWATVSFGVVLLYLLVDYRKSPALRSLRLPIFGILCASLAWSLLTVKARSAAASYGVGLINAWGTLWVATILIFNDCQQDFWRLDRDHGGEAPSRGENGVVAKGTSGIEKALNGHVDGQLSHGKGAIAKFSGPESGLRWQTYPEKFSFDRLDWITDLFTNFRGIGWNFQISTIPPIPAGAGSSLKAKPESGIPDSTESKVGIRRFASRGPLLRTSALRSLLACCALDVIKLVMHADPYFWGYTSSPVPTSFPAVLRAFPVLTQSYRLLLALTALYAALNQMLGLGPLFFTGLLGSRIAGLRGEAFMNPPDFYGSLGPIFSKGLAGWWGGWWHQTFRFAFEAPTTRILQTWGIEKRSLPGKLVGLLVAFALSGCLHACGSYSQLGESRPLLGPFRFFMLQAVGIMVQDTVAETLKLLNLSCLLPRKVRRWTNFLYANIWLYFTAPLLVEDFAQGGVWLYEPLPISPLRMLGFGAADETGWGLWNDLVFWRNGEHWWDTGLAF